MKLFLQRISLKLVSDGWLVGVCGRKKFGNLHLHGDFSGFKGGKADMLCWFVVERGKRRFCFLI